MSDEQDKAIENLLTLKKAYNEFFSSDAGKIVIADLEAVCHEYTTTFDENPHRHALNEGNRQVLKHIKSRMNLQNVIELLEPNKGETNA